MQHPPPRQHRIVGGVHAARGSRTAAGENPFASFYESRRKISLDTDDDETSDPSSSITRAYIVPDALLALARGERESSVENLSVDAGPAGGRALRRVASTLAAWLRRAWRRSIPN
jgi:hypothetical protein